MRTPQLFDIVRLTSPAPEFGVAAGETGTIVEVFASPREAYEVEFSDDHGETIAMFSLTASDFEVAIPRGVPVPVRAGT